MSMLLRQYHEKPKAKEPAPVEPEQESKPKKSKK
jgi:hypothetical protein